MDASGGQGEHRAASLFALAERALSASSGDFLRGFLAGQVALVLLLIGLLRFFLLRGVPGTGAQRPHRTAVSAGQGSPPASLVRIKVPPAKEGPAESCEWVNALLQPIILEPLMEALQRDETICALSLLLSRHDDEGGGNANGGSNDSKDGNGSKGESRGSATLRQPSSRTIGNVTITGVTLEPSALPHISWIKVVAPDAAGGEEGCVLVRLEMVGGAACSFSLDTSLLINYPPGTPLAALPCSLTVNVERIAATLSIAIQEEATPARGRIAAISVQPDDFVLDLTIQSLLGSRSKLRDVPKVAEVIEWRLRRLLSERLFPPASLVIALSVDGLLQRSLEALLGRLSPHRRPT